MGLRTVLGLSSPEGSLVVVTGPEGQGSGGVHVCGGEVRECPARG